MPSVVQIPFKNWVPSLPRVVTCPRHHQRWLSLHFLAPISWANKHYTSYRTCSQYQWRPQSPLSLYCMWTTIHWGSILLTRSVLRCFTSAHFVYQWHCCHCSCFQTINLIVFCIYTSIIGNEKKPHKPVREPQPDHNPANLPDMNPSAQVLDPVRRGYRSDPWYPQEYPCQCLLTSQYQKCSRTLFRQGHGRVGTRAQSVWSASPSKHSSIIILNYHITLLIWCAPLGTASSSYSYQVQGPFHPAPHMASHLVASTTGVVIEKLYFTLVMLTRSGPEITVITELKKYNYLQQFL